MALREPTRTTAKVWLGQFNQAYHNWLTSGSADAALLERAKTALKHLLEREPEAGDLVATLVLSVLFNGQSAISPLQVLGLADLGLQANQLVADKTPGRDLRGAFFEIQRARAHLTESQWFDCQKCCERGIKALCQSAKGPLSEFLQADAHYLQGAALDACLEFASARKAFEQAQNLSLVLIQQSRLGKLISSLARFVFDSGEPIPQEVLQTMIQRTWQDVAQLVVASSIGIGRSDALLDASTRQESAIHVIETIKKLGIGSSSPLDLAPIARRNNPDLALSLVTTAIDKAGELGLRPEEFESVLCSVAAMVMAENGLDPTPMLVRAETARQELQDPLFAAVTAGMEMVTHSALPSSGAISPAGDRFRELMQELETSQESRLENWRIRALLDEPLLCSLRQSAMQFEQDCSSTKTAKPQPKGKKAAKSRGTSRKRSPSPAQTAPAALDSKSIENRRVLSRFLDFLQREQTKFERWHPSETQSDRSGSKQNQERFRLPEEALTGDLLGRLKHALQSWPQAMALLIRDLGPDTLFISVCGQGGISVSRSGAGARESANALRQKLLQEIDALQLTGQACEAEDIQALGQAAYSSWSKELRNLVSQKQVLLVSPDQRYGGERVPFELLHDGEEWLGIQKIVARFPSVRSLTRSVEGTLRRDAHLRLLALAVPEAEGFDSLNFALEESVQTRVALAAQGWDAPEIDSSRVTSQFLLDRLSFVTHLHISAHGQEDLEGDYLMLAQGSRLYPKDLLARYLPRMPTIYLNACSLGSSRYLGGGMSHGIAHTLVESGAPAVIANLLPVDDAVSARLASLFYGAVAEGFGEGLQMARRQLASENVSPVLWGSTILIGDPRTSLVPKRPQPVLSEKLLDAFFCGLEEKHRKVIIEESERELISSVQDVRLQAAAGLLRRISQWPAEPSPSHRSHLIAAFRVAWELDHRPTAATLAYLLASTFDDELEPRVALAVIEEALELMEPLEQENTFFKSMLDRLLMRWMQLRRADNPLRVRVGGSADAVEEQELRKIGQAVFDIQLSQEARALRRGDAPLPVGNVRCQRDLLWNAVLARRELNFEDPPEVFAFASRTSRSLVELNCLPEKALPFASTMIAGLLSWLWDSQHAADLPRDLAEGQTGCLACLVSSLRENWPPYPPVWAEALLEFQSEVKLALAALDRLTYAARSEERMQVSFAEIERRADLLLTGMGKRYPERLPEVAAWILGCLIECNTYSYADGSEPERTCERLKQTHGNISERGEELFMPWLMEGFRQVRERTFDELDRWKFGMSPK